MIRTRLRGRIGGTWRIWSAFREKAASVPEVTIYLIGRDVQHAESPRALRRQLAKVLQCCLQQHRRTDQIRMQKLLGRIDRTVDMALGSQVDHGGGLMTLE